MAGNGPIPKNHRQRHRDTKRRDRDVRSVVPDGVLRGPELPDDHGYAPRTVAYYETWRHSPQAQVFEDTDWLALQLILPLFDANLRKPSAAAVTEIRMTTAALGGTYADRLRVAKLHVDRSGEADDTLLGAVGSNVAPITARRDSIRARLAADPEPEPELVELPTASDPAPF